MKPPLDPSSMFLLLVPLLISVNFIPTSLGADDYRYTNCSSTTFSCGKSLAYPFWGGDRPNYCGLPDFQVICEGDILTITIRSLKYRVLQLYSTSPILVVARDDYFDIYSCPADYKNNTFDQTPFTYVEKGLASVTILYNCPTSSFPPPFPSNIIDKPCKKADGSDIPVYYFAGPWYSSDCTSVFMPIYEENFGEVAADTQDVLRKGFGLQYKVNNNEECKRCSQSGGQCGYEGGQFSCFCKDGPKKTSCSGIVLFYQNPVFICSLEPWIWKVTL
ncbi:hypothetical protein K1719_001278 [Acacia pycnantha]|nr:hypothetical protein K1719_001278 [Acacia pycnantha]